MRKIPKSDDKPKWITENIPQELLGSNFFVFQINLRAVDPQTRKPLVITVDLLPDLDVDYEILEQQAEDIPAQYAFWASVYSELRNNVALLERAVKIRKGEAIEEVQKRARDENIRFTADQVKSVVEADKELNRTESALSKIQMQTGKVYHMMEALRTKADLVRTLAGFKRQEQDNG